MSRPLRIVFAIATVWMLEGCENIGPIRGPFHSPSSELAGHAAPVGEFSECPRLAGVFQNESADGSGLELEQVFSVPGFKSTEGTVSKNYREVERTTSRTAIHILGGIKNGYRQSYRRVPGELFTIAIRTKFPGTYSLVVTSSRGDIGIGEANLRGSCANGMIEKYAPTSRFLNGVPIEVWRLDSRSGDIVQSYNPDWLHATNHDAPGNAEIGQVISPSAWPVSGRFKKLAS